MIRLGIYLCSILLFFQSPSYSYKTISDPKDFVKELVSEAISKLSDKSLSDEEKAKFIEEVALDNVDIKALGLYTLGELRKSSEKDDLEKYQNAFERYFLKV